MASSMYVVDALIDLSKTNIPLPANMYKVDPLVQLELVKLGARTAAAVCATAVMDECLGQFKTVCGPCGRAGAAANTPA